MKTLIVEDDFINRVLLQELLKEYGPTHVAVNGQEAVDAVRMALETDDPYNLICMDIMMPEMDGLEALKKIREEEEKNGRGISTRLGAKIVMTTALNDMHNVFIAYQCLCDAYLTKPIKKKALLDELFSLGLIR